MRGRRTLHGEQTIREGVCCEGTELGDLAGTKPWGLGVLSPRASEEVTSEAKQSFRKNGPGLKTARAKVLR